MTLTMTDVRPTLTERQRAAWDTAVAEAQSYLDRTELPKDIDDLTWLVRPARNVSSGKPLTTAAWFDGERLVVIHLDLEGRYNLQVGEVDRVRDIDDDEHCVLCSECR